MTEEVPVQMMANEAQVTAALGVSRVGSKLHRWVSVGKPDSQLGIRLNWLTSVLAVVITFGFSFYTLDKPTDADLNFKKGKAWVSQNFTWLYIITQDVWCFFLIYLIFSKFGGIKLGKDNEKPRYNDFTWFCMLFTCGVAVGLYVFGAAEPLYFYRQPTVWQSWAYDYEINKVDGRMNDAKRAQQAIFMAVYHWGIHGWVPYILIALCAGVVSFRWGLPMTIRSCFYPLLGDHVWGLVGDFIDALSISTTTFGVCTSLGLGVSQLSSGLQFLNYVSCDVKKNCEDSGGTWDINTYGAENCVLPAGESYDDCKLSWLKTADSKTDSYYTIICLITAIATLSVLSGLDRGIKTLSMIAFTLGMVVLVTVLLADNTWYLLNVMVQTVGYYLNYVLVVGFDCEAFQQLNFEFGRGTNYLWGSDGDTSVLSKVAAVGLDVVAAAGNDCGAMLNPCMQGVISAGVASSLTMALASPYGMSPDSVSRTPEVYATLKSLYVDVTGVPCGSGWNTTHFDATTVKAVPSASVGDPLCPTTPSAPLPSPSPEGEMEVIEGELEVIGEYGSGDDEACSTFWAGAIDATSGPVFPRCPEMSFEKTSTWGTCESYMKSCHPTIKYYEDSNPMFMDWWTIFYWAWWITWAPFVGFFVALISRGRTVREVIIGGFIMPTLFAILWFAVFGGLAIKMQRTAELALQVVPDGPAALATCSEHYSGGAPITPKSKALAEAGYYMLSCFKKDDQIYYLMEPYTNISGFLHVTLWLGLVIYFLTSSDSGSMTDDVISASGLDMAKIPAWQKVFWCWTEGLVAIALVNTGGALRSLQALSIVIGLPFTALLCMLVPSCFRALKREAGDEDLLQSKKFNTQLLDIFELFAPSKGSPCTPAEHMVSLLLGLFVPFVPLKAVLSKLNPESPLYNIGVAVIGQLLLILFFSLQIAEANRDNMHVLGWLFYLLLAAIIAFTRVDMRYKYNVYGSFADDVTAAVFLYPFALSQMSMMVKTDGLNTPDYFADVDKLIEVMKEKATPMDAGLPTTSPTISKTVEVDGVVVASDTDNLRGSA